MPGCAIAAGTRWPPLGGATKVKIDLYGGKVVVCPPLVRSEDHESEGHEVVLPTWRTARWAMNLMLINISTRKLKRGARLPEGDLPAITGDGTLKSGGFTPVRGAVCRARGEWMASDLAKPDLLIIQIMAWPSAMTWCWSPRLGSTEKAKRIRLALSKAPSRMQLSCRLSSTT